MYKRIRTLSSKSAAAMLDFPALGSCADQQRSYSSASCLLMPELGRARPTHPFASNAGLCLPSEE